MIEGQTREILFYAIGAAFSGTIFLVALLELIFTVKRKQAHKQIEEHVKELRHRYNDAVNHLLLEDESKIADTEDALKDTETHAKDAAEEVKQEYEAKLKKFTTESNHRLQLAKDKAKKLEDNAKDAAEEYLAKRQKQVEEGMVDLVISVVKKVLPKTLAYDVHKELVMDALRDVKSGNEDGS